MFNRVFERSEVTDADSNTFPSDLFNRVINIKFSRLSYRTDITTRLGDKSIMIYVIANTDYIIQISL